MRKWRKHLTEAEQAIVDKHEKLLHQAAKTRAEYRRAKRLAERRAMPPPAKRQRKPTPAPEPWYKPPTLRDLMRRDAEIWRKARHMDAIAEDHSDEALLYYHPIEPEHFHNTAGDARATCTPGDLEDEFEQMLFGEHGVAATPERSIFGWRKTAILEKRAPGR